MAHDNLRSATAYTRRRFISRVAKFGGAAALAAVYGLDLVARDPSSAKGLLLDRPAPTTSKKRVLILGGGVAGLSCAYELQKLGCDVLVLEARSRPGGRCWTVRAGTEETEITGERQVCRFARGQYLNAGPMRIAHHHTSTLAYCREFNIPLTTFTNYNEAAWLLAKNGTKRRIREVDADVRGYTAELLAKSLHRADLEQPLTKEDRERLIEYLRDEGRLDQALAYQKRGDTSGSLGHMEHVRGYAKSPGAFEGPGLPVDAVDLEALIKASYLHADLHDHDLNQQSTMLTPSGGMDQIPYGFAARLGRAIRYETEVQEIRRTADGRVRVVARDHSAANGTFEETADFCVCALPPNLLMKLPHDFATETASALRKAIADTAGKIGLQFKRRFWEQDDDIYGGRSLSPDPITQIYYPCEDFGATGPAALIGYYHYSNVRDVFDRPHLDREKAALDQGSKIHPQYREEFENSFSIEWHRIRHNEMSWVVWKNDGEYKEATAVLSEADGPFYFAGDWLSHLSGWQAGAFVTAHHAVKKIHARIQA